MPRARAQELRRRDRHVQDDVVGTQRVVRGVPRSRLESRCVARKRRTAESLDALREAVGISPDDARFAYVYAVALDSAGRQRDALRVLEAAVKRRPYDRDVLSGLAHFTAQAGSRDSALGYVKQLRELDPESREYAELAAQIERTAPR